MKHAIKVLASLFLEYSGVINRFDKRRHAIKILMFHQVNKANNPLGLSITPELFEELVVFLKNRYEITKLEHAVERLNSNKQIAGCVFTFDDGYRDNYDFAYPILKRYNIPATVFVTLDALEMGLFGWDLFDQSIIQTTEDSINLEHFGLKAYRMMGTDRTSVIADLHRALKLFPDVIKRQVVQYVISTYGDSRKNKQRTMLTWEEAREMAGSGLITIGAHTITHPILSRVDSTQAQYEIITGKSLIEDRLGLPVQYFAYPNGGENDFCDEHVNMVKEAGYLAACSTILGVNGLGCDLYKLRRIDVTTRMCTDSSGRFSPSLFMAKLSGLL